MSIFQIEIASKRLQNVLKIPASPKYKLLSLVNFFELIFKEPEQSIYNSYFEEFTPQFLVLIKKLSQEDVNIFFSPEEIDDIRNVISKLKDSTTFKIDLEKYEHLEDILTKEKDKAKSYLNYTKEDVITIEKFSTDSVNIVLIEKNLDENNDSDIEIGMIHRLNLSSSKRSKSERVDKVKFNNLINIEKTTIVEQLNNVTALAKKTCCVQKIKTHYYNYTYFFDLKEYIYTGSSLGIGGVVLAYNSILINELCKYYYKFRNDTVFTAEIDKEGNLVKLDKKSLKIKLRAVFFSPYKKFVIPEDNIIEAKQELEKLNKKYPKRELQLIPVQNFENVFKNLDIVERCELKFKDKVVANYRRYHTTVNWVLSIVALFVIGFFIVNYLIPTLERNPETIQYKNNRFVAYNKYDKKIWESNELDKSYSLSMENDPIHIKQKCLLSDLDHDENNEILYFLSSDSNRIMNRTFYCRNSDNTIKWKYTTPEFNVYYNNKRFEDNFVNFALYVYDFDDDGFKEIIRTGRLGYMFPFVVSKFNYKGELISEFWNSGYLIDVAALDIDKDGRVEFIAGSCNNKFRQAALVVFDPNFISGSSPETDPKKDNQKGLEKYYILFPRTIINYYSGKDMNNVEGLKQTRKDGLEVTVFEGWVGENQQNAFVLYKFDKDMNVISAELSSPFIGNYEELVNIKTITPIKDLNYYADSLKNAVRYWDGDRFVNYPVINKHYLAIKEEYNK